MTQHTPTPWTLEEPSKGFNGFIIHGSKMEEIAATMQELSVQEVEANANFILRAVNTHEEAQEILRACLDRLTEMGYSIHEVGLPQTISQLLSKMED